MKLIRAPFALILLLIGGAPGLALMGAYFNFVEAHQVSRQLEHNPPPRTRVQESLKHDRNCLLIFGAAKAVVAVLTSIFVAYASTLILRRRNYEFLGLRMAVWALFMWFGAAFVLVTFISALVSTVRK